MLESYDLNPGPLTDQNRDPNKNSGGPCECQACLVDPKATYVTGPPRNCKTLLCLQAILHYIPFPNSHIFYSSPKRTSKLSVYKRPIHRTHHPKFTYKSVVKMAGIFDGLSNLVSSIFEIFQGLISTVLSAIQSVFGLFQNLIASVFDLMSGLVGFILGMSSQSPSYIRCDFEK